MQEILKHLVVWIADKGITQIVYFSFHVLAFVSVFALAIWLGGKLKISKPKSFLTVLIVYPIMYLWMLLQYWVESGFKNFGGQNIVTIFIWVPIISLLAVKILKIDWKTMCCLIAPLVPINHAVGHLGCIIAGCCRGYPADSGLYVVNTGMHHFPSQPIESLIAFAIVVFLILMMKKQKYIPNANVYPTMLIIFGSTRFICEFFRDNEKLIWGWSKLSFHALFMAVVGIVALLIINIKKMSKTI